MFEIDGRGLRAGAVTFPPYAAGTHRVALWAKENKAKIIALTDTPISPVGQIADVVLLAVSAGMGMQNSLVAPMAVANALLNSVAAAKGTSALARYDRHSVLMNRFEAFMLKLEGRTRRRRPRVRRYITFFFGSTVCGREHLARQRLRDRRA